MGDDASGLNLLTSSDSCPDKRTFQSFQELEESVSLYFGCLTTKLDSLRHQYGQYLKKVESNFGSKAIQEIADNLQEFSNEEK